jgi:hypothetical protein
VSHVIVLSSSFSVNGRRRKKWVDGEWTSFPFLFFFYLKVSSNTLPLCKTKKDDLRLLFYSTHPFQWSKTSNNV